jgi:hypothetical protein
MGKGFSQLNGFERLVFRVTYRALVEGCLSVSSPTKKGYLSNQLSAEGFDYEFPILH